MMHNGLNDGKNVRREIAQKRWRLLIDVLTKRKRRVDNNDVVSVRRFQSYGLLKTEMYERDMNHPGHVWYKYSSPYCNSYKAIIRHLDDTLDLEDLLGFNNTGNVCVWPSEEILAYFLMKNTTLLKDKAVCELGGGMTCVAGIAASVCGEPTEVLLTDGNEKSVRSLFINETLSDVETVIDRNQALFGDTEVSASVLRWDQWDKLKDLHGKYDLVICADCLFFDECRDDLLRTLENLLKFQGQAVIFAPSRNRTFHKFAELARGGGIFAVETAECYDHIVWQLYQQNVRKGPESFDADIHYPMLMILKKVLEI